MDGEPVSWLDVIQHARRHNDLGFATAARRSLIIAAECAKRQITASPAELQAAADRWRARRRLHSAQATELWLADVGLNLDDLERIAASEVLARHLAEIVTRKDVERLLTALPDTLSTVELSRISVEDEGIARELCALIKSGEEEFAALARRYSIGPTGGADGRLPPICAIELPTDLRTSFLSQEPGGLLGPILRQAWEIYRIEAILPPNRDERTEAAIKRSLFSQWLAEREKACPFRFDTL